MASKLSFSELGKKDELMNVALIKEILLPILKLRHVHSSQLNWDLVFISYTRISALSGNFPLRIYLVS